MSMNCTDRERMEHWCAGIAGAELEERRSELLWRYARGRLEAPVTGELEAHLKACGDCREALGGEHLLAGGGKVVLAQCPSSEEMLQYLERHPAQGAWRRLEIKMHLEKCEPCREESAWAAQKVVAPPENAREPRAVWRSWTAARWAWSGAGLALLLAALWVYPNWFGPQRYARYARVPDMPYELVLAEFAKSNPDELPRFRTAAEHIQLGDYEKGSQILSELETKLPANPSVSFFRGYIALREGRWEEATLLCTKAEKRSLNGFRCWYLANVALKSGDLELAKKELRHAKGHPEYAEGVRRLEQIVH
jgi:hypothetical protein